MEPTDLPPMDDLDSVDPVEYQESTALPSFAMIEVSSEAMLIVKQRLAEALPQLAPQIHADGTAVRCMLSTVPQVTEHPITHQQETTLAVVLNLWLGPNAAGSVIAAAPVLPNVYLLSDPSALYALVDQGIRALAVEYEKVRDEFTADR